MNERRSRLGLEYRQGEQHAIEARSWDERREGSLNITGTLRPLDSHPLDVQRPDAQSLI